MTKINQIIFFLIVFIFTTSPVYARFATPDDAVFSMDFFNRETIINEDGTAKEVEELQATILKEEARDLWSHYVMYYNEANTKMNILSAKTINGDQEYVVDNKFIEDKPIASSPMGFDQYRQILIAYPNVNIGSKVYLKRETMVTKPIIPGFFATDYIWGGGGHWKTSTVKISSKIPFYLSINDQDKIISVKQFQEHGQFKAEFKLMKPVIKVVLDDGEYVSPKYFPWASITTVKNWNIVGKEFNKEYTKIMEQPLPQLYGEILDVVQNTKNELDKIDLIVAKFIDVIRYMGDWRSVKGQFIPHDLEHVANYKIGDCKDFAVGVARILKQLGMKVEIAFVNRGIVYYPHPNGSLPIIAAGSSLFNHAIIKVTLSDNKTVVWVDPTNQITMAGKIFPDIAGRPAYIISDEVYIDHIPVVDPEDVKYVLKGSISLKNKDVLHTQENIHLHGIAPYEFTGQALNLSREAIEDLVFQTINDLTHLISKAVEVPDLTSRIVKDLVFKLDYVKKRFVNMSTAGYILPLMTPTFLNNFVTHAKMVADLKIYNTPCIYEYTYDIDVKSIGNKSLDCDIKSTWCDIARKITIGKNKVNVYLYIKLKKNIISNEEQKSDEYEKFLLELTTCFLRQAGIVFNDDK